MLNPHIHIPAQVNGSSHSISSEKWALTIPEAIQNYNRACNLLLNINEWHKTAEPISAEFRYYNPTGNKSNGAPQELGYIRIKIPGPGNPSGRGYDWVRIITIDKNSFETSRYLVLCVTPSSHPDDRRNVISHFYDSRAVSVFIIHLIEKCVKVEMHGRNEHPNISNVPFIDKLRNSFTAIGAMVGFGNIQWKNLATGIIDKLHDNSDYESYNDNS